MANSALGSQSIALLQLPSGMLIDFAGTVEPVGWLMCDGRAVSRTTFSSLFASIGTAYGVGDGSTTFNLPDFRGRFARYNDNMGTAQGAASRDTGRVHGSSQADDTKAHTHTYTAPALTLPEANPSVGPISGFVNSGALFAGRGLVDKITATSSSTPATGGSETRPINLACNKLIKI